MSTFGLRAQITALKLQKTSLKSADTDARSFNRKIDSLMDEIQDDIVSDNAHHLVDRVGEFRDAPAANEYDSNINGAVNKIDQEIATIQAAIRAQEEAARALERASK